MNKPKVISTFSGVGGSSLGYKMAGCDVVAAVEFLDYQAATYRANHAGTNLFEEDIRKLDPIDVLKSVNLKPGELDILDGSPPCSSFSMAGAREDKWGESKKYGNRTQRTDDLFFEYVRFVRAIQPRAFVAENVKGLTIGIARGYLKEIMQALAECGYNVRAKVLSSANYGIPQRRERLIIVGIRNDIPEKFEFPEHKSSKYDVPAMFEGLNTTQDEAEAVKQTRPFIRKYLKVMKPGESANKYHPKGSYFTHVRIGVEHCPTITAMVRQLYHYQKDRVLTIPEVKALTGFPKDFKLLGKPERQWEACGRTVPPPMMAAVAKAVTETLWKNSTSKR